MGDPSIVEEEEVVPGAWDGARRIDLPPGRYVAVGARAGYRDARVTFEVTPATADTAWVTRLVIVSRIGQPETVR